MRRNSLFWGLVFVVLGGLLLLNNFVVLRFNIWKVFWPLLVILLGVWILWQTMYGKETLETVLAAIPLEGASEARISIHHGAGELRVGSGATPDELVSGSFAGGLNKTMNLSGSHLDLSLKVPTEGFPFVIAPWLWTQGNRISWDIQLNPQVPISLEVNSGASDAQLDLSETLVKELVLKTGASATKVITPAKAEYTRLKVEAGAASVKVTVPEGVAARLDVDGGLLDVKVDQSRFPKTDKVYQSPDYDTAPHRLDIKVDAGVGSISVE